MEETTKVNDLLVDVSVDLIMAEALKSFTTPEQIEALEGELLGDPNNREVIVSHAFCKGIYARTAIIPAGTIAIGHAHHDECLNIVVKGSVSVVIDGEVKRISAPATFVSPPHARKIGYIHEELTWVTVHPVSHYDVNKLDNELLEKSETFKKYENSTALAVAKVDEFTEDRIDYLKVVEEFGLTHEKVKEIVENTSDQIIYPCDKIEVKTSRIQGNGVISRFFIKAGETVGVASLDGKRTQIGRYTNHSCYPNGKMDAQRDGSINLVATRDINEGEEVVVDYRESFVAAKEAAEILNKLKL